MRNVYLIIALIALFQIACEKEAEVDLFERSNSIHYGQNENMSIRSFNRSIKSNGSGHIDSMLVDLNGDSIYEIKISSNTYGSLGLGYRSSVSIECLHEKILLAGSRKDDTTFFGHSGPNLVLIEDDSTQPGYIKMFESRTWACSRLDSTYVVDGIQLNVFRLQGFQKDGILEISDEFLSDQFGFGSSGCVNQYGGYQSGDTTYITNRRWCNDCDIIAGETYVGYKLLRNGTERLGWIKIEVNGGSATLLETAIQSLENTKGKLVLDPLVY